MRTLRTIQVLEKALTTRLNRNNADIGSPNPALVARGWEIDDDEKKKIFSLPTSTRNELTVGILRNRTLDNLSR